MAVALLIGNRFWLLYNGSPLPLLLESSTAIAITGKTSLMKQEILSKQTEPLLIPALRMFFSTHHLQPSLPTIR
jgi:hypothetical protein